MCTYVCTCVFAYVCSVYILCTYICMYISFLYAHTYVCTLSYSFVCVSVLLQPKEHPEILVSLSYKENERRLQGLVLKARHINLPSTSDSESEYSSFVYSTYVHTWVLRISMYVHLYAYLLRTNVVTVFGLSWHK